MPYSVTHCERCTYDTISRAQVSESVEGSALSNQEQFTRDTLEGTHIAGMYDVVTEAQKIVQRHPDITARDLVMVLRAVVDVRAMESTNHPERGYDASPDPA